MALYSAPPPARPFSDDKPILLVSWWITIFCALVILLRLIGRYVRVERLFGEDKIAALVLIPLFLRMAFVHPALVYGTNNVALDTDGLKFTELELRHRAVGSGLVLGSRIIQPAILWLLKVVTLEFFDRLVGLSGRNRYTLLLRFMRATLGLTFVAVVISDLAECRPFTHYWQVSPDPGPQCRQGYAQLLTTTACNVLTDLLLVVFPVPIVVKSRLALGRKVVLVGLFCLHLFTVVVAIYRVPQILDAGGYQATRTLWASGEVLMATFAANALTIGTFVRDTGVKKQKFKYQQPTGTGTEGLMSSRGSGGRPGRRGGKGGVTGTGVNGKSVTWDDEDDAFDGADGEAGRMTGSSSRADHIEHSRNGSAVKEGMVVGHDGESPRSAIPRTESRDSLIPRSRFATATPDGGTKVIKTTTIEVTVAAAENYGNGHVDRDQVMNGLVLTPAAGVVTASARGRVRGSNTVAQELHSLPGVDVGK